MKYTFIVEAVVLLQITIQFLHLQVSLIIVEVFPEDQGQYICVAQNPAGQATTSAYLRVHDAQETTMELGGEPQVGNQSYLTYKVNTAHLQS